VEKKDEILKKEPARLAGSYPETLEIARVKRNLASSNGTSHSLG
jgi:hypothetical protein